MSFCRCVAAFVVYDRTSKKNVCLYHNYALMCTYKRYCLLLIKIYMKFARTYFSFIGNDVGGGTIGLARYDLVVKAIS